MMETIFLSLLNMSITAGWLILAVIALRVVLKKAPRWIFCLLWAFAAFRLVCPFSFESVFSIIPSKETISHEALLSPAPSIDSGVRLVDNVVNPVLRQSFAPKPEASANPLQIWLTVAGFLWAAGMAVMLSHAAVGYIRLYLRVRTAVRLDGRVYVSEFADTPFILGVARPRIYLPASMPGNMRGPVIAHEQAHLKRLDHLWKVCGYALLAVYWFHPLCWAAYMLFCRDLELACDEKVIRSYDACQKKAYSEALLACSSGRRTPAAYPLAFGEVGVKERIKSVLHYKKPAFWAVAAAALACGAAAVCFLTDPVEAQNEPVMTGAADSDGKRSADGLRQITGAGQMPEGLAALGGGYLNSGRINGTLPKADGSWTNSILPETGGNRQASGILPEAGGSWQTRNTLPKAGGSGYADSGRTNGTLPEAGGSGQADSGQQNGSGTNGALSGRDANGQTPENLSDTNSLQDTLRKWSHAFVSHDGNTIASMASPALTAALETRGLLYGNVSGGRSFGDSEPWPLDADLDISIYGYDAGTAEIHYYAWSKEPHVTVWKELLSYELQDGGYVITSEELVQLKDISSGGEFARAYGAQPDIDLTRMDYARNGAGEVLNQNALLSSTTRYTDLWEPERAAVKLLNLSADSSKVKIKRILDEGSVVGLEITFPEDDVSVQLGMVQPYGSYGIWIPQNYQVNPVYRFSKMDWDEIRNRRLSPDGNQDWSDIVCIGKIPEKDITLYGYNDEECFGRGIAIEIGDDVNYFDWIYTTPRTLLPECFWDEKNQQLQAALNIYTGTELAAQELHVLQRYATGTLSDNVFSWEDFADALRQRISFEFDKDSQMLTLTDSQTQKELASVRVAEGEVESLALGNISHFVLGENIFLLVEPGYYTTDGVIAEYENMPVLQAEVLIQGNASELTFALGTITAN